MGVQSKNENLDNVCKVGLKGKTCHSNLYEEGLEIFGDGLKAKWVRSER